MNFQTQKDNPMKTAAPEAAHPSEWAMHTAAQLWQLPQHSSKVMDTELALSIARALDKAVAFAKASGMDKAPTAGYGLQQGIFS